MAISRSQMKTQLTGDRMPAKSEKQRKFMAAVANNPKFAKKVGVPKNVGEEFMKPKKYKSGGAMKSSPRPRMRPEDMEDMPRRRGGAPMSSPRPRPRPRPRSMEEDGGAVARGNRAAMREAYDQETLANGMKKGGKVKKMAKGGKVRGCGMARGGAVRQCKMVKMKGS